MTIQTALLDTFDYGAALDSATARAVTTDNLTATATSTNRVTGAGSGLYAVVFDLASVISGPLRIRAVVGGQPITRYVTFAGVDGEMVQTRREVNAELDSTTIQSVRDWSDTEKAQIRYRLGLDGTATAPSDPDGETITIDPGSGNITTGYATCLTPEGSAQSGVKVYAQLIEAASSSTGFAFDASQSSVVSASNGVAQMPLIKGATYLIWRGKQDTGRTITVPSDAGSTYALPSLVGY